MLHFLGSLSNVFLENVSNEEKNPTCACTQMLAHK